MNKKKINALLPQAEQVLRKAFPKKIPKEFRGYIASFGAAIAMGSLTAAVAFYSARKHSAAQNRETLPELILELLKQEDSSIHSQTLFAYVTDKSYQADAKEQVLHAAIALKLAMNLFEFEE